MEYNVKCVILVPTTMHMPQGKCVKTDKFEAALIAKCLTHRTYHEVYILAEDDHNVKEYILMRDDHKKALVRINQLI